MPEYHSDSLVPPKHGVISSFAMLTWFSIVVVFIGVIAMFALKFDFSRLRGSDHFIGKAREAISAKDWQAAVEALRHVNAKDRDEVAYLRVLADFLEASRTEPSLLDTVLDKLDAKGLMQPGDFIWACRLRILAGNVEAARRALDSIPESERRTAEFIKLNIQILIQQGRLQDATAMENVLFETFPDDPETAVRKAAHELDGAFPETQQAAFKRLWELAKREDEHGNAAIHVLCLRQGLALAEAQQLHELADHRSGVPIADRLQIASLLMKLDPARHDQILSAEIQRYENADVLEKSQMASWLAREKEYDKILTLVPQKILMKSAELFPQVAQSLAEKGKWAELAELVKKGKKLPVSEARAATWRVLAYKNLHPEDIKEIRARLLEAIQESHAERSGLALMGAARLAEEWSMADLAFKAYDMLAVQGTPQEAEMLDKCWKMALIFRDSKVLLKLADRRAKLRPGNVQLTQLRDYMHLLCGDQLETTLAAAPIHSVNPDLPERSSDAYLLNLALKAYRLHDLDLVNTTLGKVHNSGALNAGERAVCAGLKALSGQTAQAFQLAESVRPELLLPEEFVFLKLAF